jgi:hypothetical protein
MLLVLLAKASMSAQPTINAGLGWVGFSATIGIDFEYNILPIKDQIPFNSLRISSGIGGRILNAWYIPLEARLILFGSSNHIEIIAGVNTQVYWEETSKGTPTTKRLGSALFNPTFGFAYRFEPKDGGFLFRAGLGCIYSVGDSKLFPTGTACFGWSF